MCSVSFVSLYSLLSSQYVLTHMCLASHNWPDATCQVKIYIDQSNMVKIQDNQMQRLIVNTRYNRFFCKINLGQMQKAEQ